MNDNFVYVMSDGQDYKIGVSINPVERALEITRELKKPISLLLSINCKNAYGCEGYLHKKYADRNVCREWFAFEDRSFINDVWYVCTNDLISNRNFISVDSKLNQKDPDVDKLVQNNLALSYDFVNKCTDFKYNHVLIPAMLLGAGCKKVTRSNGAGCPLYITPRGLEEKIHKMYHKEMGNFANTHNLEI